jgi:septum formation protein
MDLILASSSPRRLELLVQLGIDPVVVAADVDESVLDGETPDEYVQRVSELKCRAVSSGPADVVLAADTTVAIDGDILGKPGDEATAATMLARLSGRTHEVHTAVSLARDATLVTGLETSIVSFRTLAPADIDWYVATGEPFDKAGAYGIQGAGGLFVQSVDGSADNIVGLPRALTSRLFDRLGLRLLDFSRFGR